jgi:hypothetical protein
MPHAVWRAPWPHRARPSRAGARATAQNGSGGAARAEGLKQKAPHRRAIAEEILATRATTLAGIVAKIVMALTRDDQWCLDAGSDQLEPVAQAVLADLRAMMA